MFYETTDENIHNRGTLRPGNLASPQIRASGLDYLTSSGGNPMIELNAGFGTVSANYDDVTLAAVPESGTAMLLLCGLGSLLFVRPRK